MCQLDCMQIPDFYFFLMKAYYWAESEVTDLRCMTLFKEFSLALICWIG